MKRFLATGLASILFSLMVMADESDLYFSHLTTKMGLSSNFIHCIYKDSRGFMWFGTDDGLNLFDGYDFTVFKYNSLDTTSLSSNSVFRILEDSRGRFWIGASQGVDIFEPETRSFRHIPFLEDVQQHRYLSYTRALIEDQHGNILIANTTGIYRYAEKEKGFVPFLKNLMVEGSTQQEGIRTMLIDRQNRLWVGSISSGLFGYDLNKREIIAGSNETASIRIRDRIFDLEEDAEGNIWVGSDKGIYLISSDLSRCKEFPPVSELGSEDDDVWDIFVEEDKRVWIATDRSGLLIYNLRDSLLTGYQADDVNPTSINHNSVRTILMDDQGLLWIGTSHGGIDYARIDRKKKFTLIRNEKGNENSLAYNAVAALYEDSGGDLWIGTDGGGLDRFDPESGTFTHYIHQPGDRRTISGNAILTITEDEDGNIWVGGYLSGVNVINKTKGVIKTFLHDPDDPSSLSNDDVRDILIQDENTVWIATNGGGLNKLDRRAGKFSHFLHKGTNSLVNNWCLKLYNDLNGDLWIGTYDGLSIMDMEDYSFTNFTRSDTLENISNSWIYIFAQSSPDYMWIGTANGLNYYNYKTQEISVIPVSAGMQDNIINGLLIDGHDNLWLSTNSGLTQYDPTDTSFHHYDVYDGLQGNQFIHGSCFKGDDGQMYFGGYGGLNLFYPDSIFKNDFVPPVFLTDLLIFYKEVDIGAEDSPLQKSITESEEIILRYYQDVVTFKYTALNYINSGKNQYSYMLEGFDKGWINAGSRREATYTNLSPGNYVFRVRAANNDGIWNEEGVALKVTVLPPWWETLLFRIIVLVLLLFLMYIFYLYRVGSYKRQRALLEKQVEERTHEIKEKSKLLEEQAEELRQINTLLEERNRQIESQAEGLAEANSLLEERQQQIEEQTEELMASKEEMENVNEHLQELNSTKDKFFSIIAHDLKNPFGTILGFTELISARYDTLPEEKKRYFVNIIYKSTQNIFNLLENLLQWSRSQTNRMKFERTDINLRDLIEENISLLLETCKKKNINIEYHFQNGEEVYADRNMINTVLRNLMSNAVKFSNSSGIIQINISSEKGYARISVKDEGVGIPKNEIDQLFRVDTQYSREGTAGEGGTGLGLILCKEYISKHEGDIWVVSEENRGCTFHFTLPAKPLSKN